MTLSARRKRRGACGAAGGRVTGTRRLQIQVGTPIPVHEGRFLRDMEKKHDGLTYREIEQATQIPASDLKHCLQSLACVKGENVLSKEPMSKDIAEDDAFYFDDKFTSKFIKVKIGTVAAQKESEPEKQETRQRMEEDRKPQIEAVIVRIMRSRRVLDHNTIVTEVTSQLQSRFLPNPVVTEKRIESFIDLEFLERDKADRKLYQFLA